VQSGEETTVVADLRAELARDLGRAAEHVVLVRPDRIVAAVFRPEDDLAVQARILAGLGAPVEQEKQSISIAAGAS
jgi:hypothetical protein